MSADLEGTVSTLRACLLSSKGGVSLSTLNRDYKSLVGTHIPFKQLGYNNVEDFLKNIDDIKVSYGANRELFVRAVPSEESAHMASLVSRQKTSQKKRAAVPSFGRRRPSNQFRPPLSSTSYRYVPPQKKEFSVTINNNAYERPNRSVQATSKPLATTAPEEPNLKHRYELPPRLQKQKEENLINDVNFSNSVKITSSTKTYEESDTNGFDPVSTSFNLEDNMDDLERNNESTVELNYFDNYQSGLSQKSKKSIVSPFSPRYAIAAGRAQTEAQAVKELESKYAKKNEESDYVQDANDIDIEYNMEVAPWNRVKPGLERTESFTCKLLKYCCAKGWPEPTYKFLERRPKNSPLVYGCQVKVGLREQHFSSYPEESCIQEEARDFAAKKAYTELTKNESDVSDNFRHVTKDIGQIQDRIFEMCLKHDAGIWANSIPTEYAVTYKEHLPPDWLKIASTFSKLSLNTVYEGGVIICSNKQPDIEKLNVPTPEAPTGIHTQAIPPPEDTWDVYVTFVESADEIYIRIIGTEFSEKYENLSVEMEQYFSQRLHHFEAPPSDLHVEGYFAARIIDDERKDSWHRVCVQSIKWEDKTVEAWLVDNGECVLVSLKQIFHLPKQFTTLPRQAVACSLADLEHHVDDDTLIETMFHLLVGNVLVAQVIQRDNIENTYSLVFYDTSSDEDVNINEKLIDVAILKSQPQLPKNEGVKEVYVSHILEEGRLYVQVHNNSFNYLKKIIAGLSNSVILQNCLKSSNDISCGKIYLAKTKKGDWYRATITRIPPGNQVEVKFIDYGNCELINISEICNLEAISNTLSRIPNQALPVLLQGVTISEQGYEYIKKMVPPDEPVLLKVITDGVVPKVEIFKRAAELEGGALISINNSISFESSKTARQRQPIRRTKSLPRIVTPSVLPTKAPVQDTSTVYLSLSPPVIPEVNSGFFDVLVTTAANPNNFIVQPLEDINRLQELSNEMKTFYTTENTGRWIPQTFVEGGLYAALFNNNSQWYRVTLAQLYDECATVHSCDFGDYKLIPTKNLRCLAIQFTKLPYQGIKAKLTGIEPIHTDWVVEDCIRFQDLVVDKQLVSIVLEKGPDLINPSETVVTLKLIDTNTDEDVVIADVLVDEKRARKTC